MAEASKTEQLQVENDRLRALLAAREGIFRAAVSSAPVGMAIIQAEPPTYLDVNDAFCGFLGRSREEILSADPFLLWSKITHPEDFIAEQEHLGRIINGSSDGYQMRKRYILPNGEERWGHLAFSAVRALSGVLEYAVGQIVDVHEQVLVEQRLRQSQKLEAIGQLAGGIAHDFNNLLTVVMGCADILQRKLEPDDPCRAYSQAILHAAERGADLTRQVLAYGRRQVLLPQIFAVSDSVGGTNRLVERLLGEQVQLSARLDAKGHIKADKGQVEQIVMNLVLNARDAMPGGGRLTIETDDVDHKESPSDQNQTIPPGPYVRIQVVDEGVGMTPDVVAHIFEPFFTTKESGKGTGLGLSMVWGTIQQSGGFILVNSAPNQGSRFEIYFPRVEAVPQKVPMVSAEVSLEHRHATILVAEDDAAVRQLVAEVLRGFGYSVLTAESASRAEIIAGDNPIDLVISDMVMPGKDGLSLLESLRRQKPDLRALIVSGYNERAAALAESVGGANYLFKPFVPAALLERVRQILG